MTERASAIELELMDLTPEPICFDAHVAWSVRWDEGPELPGAGLYWDTDSTPQGFRESLGTPERVKRMMPAAMPVARTNEGKKNC